MIAQDASGHVARVATVLPLARAEKQPLTTERLRAQLGRLGGTPFKLGALKNELADDVILPVSELNRLRREAVAELERQRALPKRWTLVVADASQRQTSHPKPSSQVSRALTSAATELIVLVRDLAQLEAAMQWGATTRTATSRTRRSIATRWRCFAPGMAVPVLTRREGRARPSAAPPRIFKMGEEWTLEQVRSCHADGYLVRNYDHLNFFAADRRVGDFSLNIANRLAADYFRNKFGLERVTASYDLNVQQLEALLTSAPPEWFEITIHQHMPMFHMEHCVFCAFLSSGKDYRDCGRPCDVHEVRLRDRVGREHPLKADVGCRNTVFNAQAQTGAEFVQRLLTLGARHFRVEFLNESPAEVTRTLARYRQLLRGEITGSQLWRELKLFNQLGVTRGQLAG